MRTRLATAAILLALLPAGISAQSADAIDAPRISQQEFKKLVDAKNVVIVDTRNSDEFAKSHMPGALELPLEGRLTWPDAYEKTVAILQKTRKPVVVYCA
jgi:rhodanese-related sulfurtransferase